MLSTSWAENNMSIQRTKALFERLRHPFSARHVQLLAREYISPNFIRLTLGGPDMAGFKSLGFDDHVKLILPQAGQQKPNLPYLVDEKPQVDEPRPIMRDYTPLNYDERLNTIELDFALHAGNGPAMQRSEEHTSELQSRGHLVCRLLLEKKTLMRGSGA